MNLVLFWVADTFQLPFLPYHTGTLYVAALCGTGAAILTTGFSFLVISLFRYGIDFMWLGISGIIIAAIIGEQFKKETRITSWLVAAGEVLFCDLFFYIFVILWKQNSIPFDYCSQRIFMFFYEQGTDEILCVCIAGLAIVTLSVIIEVTTAFLAILCTPKKWLYPPEESNPSEQKRLKSKKKKNGTA